MIISGFKCGSAILVAPKLILSLADLLFEGDRKRDGVVFRVLECSAEVVWAWKVGDCALGQLERDMSGDGNAVVGLPFRSRGLYGFYEKEYSEVLLWGP